MTLIVTKEGRSARRLSPSDLPHEDFLQEYIVENPEVLPLNDLAEDLEFLVLAREFPTECGPIDAVGVDNEGKVYILETKLYKNPDKRRVVAQVMDYGAALWSQAGAASDLHASLERHTQRTLGKGLTEALVERFGLEDEELQELLEAIAEGARDGEFRFVVLMERIDDRLKDLIRFLNENSRFDLYAIELAFYEFDGYEAAIPRLFGAEVRKEVSTGSTRAKWDEGRYFDQAEKRLSSNQFVALRRLFDFGKQHADRIKFGTGAKTGSFGFVYEHVCPRTVITCFADGRIGLNFPWLAKDDGPLPPEARQFASNLESIAGFEIDEDIEKRYPHLDVEEWVPKVDLLIEAIEKSFAKSAV